MGRFKLLLVFAVILVMPVAVAQDYYADVDINVKQNGLVSINGNTNHPALNVDNTQDFTSKDGKYWVVNITINDTFSDFIYRLNLPENSKVNYFKTPGFSRIEHSSSGLTVIGTGENEPFSITAQYTIDYSDNKNYLYLLGLLLLAGVVFSFAYYRKPKAALPPLTDRQKIIYNTVNKYKKPVTQKEIEKNTSLPKASVSRNIETLVQKGVLKKEVQGMSNIISVPERSGNFRQK